MTVTGAISDLGKSVSDLIGSLFRAVYTIIHSVFSIIGGFFTGIFNLVGDILSGAVHATGSVGKFVAGNIVILGVLALAGFVYMRYTAHGRQQVAGAKKTN